MVLANGARTLGNLSSMTVLSWEAYHTDGNMVLDTVEVNISISHGRGQLSVHHLSSSNVSHHFQTQYKVAPKQCRP